MLKSLRKGCPDVTITQDTTKSDYIVDAIKKPDSNSGVEYRLVLSDHSHKIVGSSEASLTASVRDICHAIVGALIVEVVDSQNLTQSQDTRGNTSGGAAGAVVNGLTGRRTHTDNSMVYVIINGEHALLDCYERRKGCTPVGPGKYTGQRDGNSIWISYEMPVTHEPVRNHYKIAGGW
ncbi:MAG TPA: hypothetical protein VMD99_02685 [Terriglobales bacterium]|nr:hypothetical protein [Terriglobales bacterium]